MTLEMSDREGYYRFHHEDCSEETFEYSIRSQYVPWVLSADEMAVIQNFKLILLSK